MEVRGGNGYIEDWVAPRLIRDAHVGVLWEGTSSIVALDVVQRAVAKKGAEDALREAMTDILEDSDGIPPALAGSLSRSLDRAVSAAQAVAGDATGESLAREAAGALYDTASAMLMVAEGAALGGRGGDARRLLLARMVVDHRLTPRDPLAPCEPEGEAARIAHLLDDMPVAQEAATALLAGS